MTILAQHGYGKSDKVDKGFSAGHISGAILSPRSELPVTLQATAKDLRAASSDCLLMVDPQFHFSAISPVKLQNLEKYPYFKANLTRRSFLASGDIDGYCKDALDYQLTLPVNYLISPTVMFSSFNDIWSQVSLQMALASANYHSTLTDAPPLLISLVFAEEALPQAAQLDDFLNEISVIDGLTGFYIVVRRFNSDYRPHMEPSYLENLLYLVYSLAHVNNYDVVVGYSDLVGLILHCFGVIGTGCGWFATTRQFCPRTYEPSSGGSQPRPRYTSNALLSSILLFPELDQIVLKGQGQHVLSNLSYDTALAQKRDPWTPHMSVLHHWESLQHIAKEIEALSTVQRKLDLMQTKVKDALGLYSLLQSKGIVFEASSGPSHLAQWDKAISNFRTRVNV